MKNFHVQPSSDGFKIFKGKIEVTEWTIRHGFSSFLPKSQRQHDAYKEFFLDTPAEERFVFLTEALSTVANERRKTFSLAEKAKESRK